MLFRTEIRCRRIAVGFLRPMQIAGNLNRTLRSETGASFAVESNKSSIQQNASPIGQPSYGEMMRNPAPTSLTDTSTRSLKPLCRSPATCTGRYLSASDRGLRGTVAAGAAVIRALDLRQITSCFHARRCICQTPKCQSGPQPPGQPKGQKKQPSAHLRSGSPGLNRKKRARTAPRALLDTHVSAR